MAICASEFTIVRGTTPTILCEMPEGMDLSNIFDVWFSVSQGGILKIDKTFDDGSIVIDDGDFLITLSQEDTLSLTTYERAYASLRFTSRDQFAYANYPLINITVSEILREGVIA